MSKKPILAVSKQTIADGALLLIKKSVVIDRNLKIELDHIVNNRMNIL